MGSSSSTRLFASVCRAATAAAGALGSGVVEAVAPPLVLSYVTTAAAGHKAIIHVHSASASPVSVHSLLFDGAEVPTAEGGGGGLVIPPKGHAVFVAELPRPKAHGAVWPAPAPVLLGQY